MTAVSVTQQPPEAWTESEIRAMRDEVFGKPTTDKNWSFCREHWMRFPENLWLHMNLWERSQKGAQ